MWSKAASDICSNPSNTNQICPTPWRYLSLGLDRLVTILTRQGKHPWRYRFPKDPEKDRTSMTDSPGTATDRQLRDLKVQSIAEDA